MRLIEERKRRGWSQAELARRAHLNAATLSQIESGRLTPYGSQVQKIADALGLPPARQRLRCGIPRRPSARIRRATRWRPQDSPR